MTTMTDAEIELEVEAIFRELGSDGCRVNTDAMIFALNRHSENPRLRGVPLVTLTSIASFADEHGLASCSHAQIARRATIIMQMIRLVSEVGAFRIKCVMGGFDQ